MATIQIGYQNIIMIMIIPHQRLVINQINTTANHNKLDVTQAITFLHKSENSLIFIIHTCISCRYFTTSDSSTTDFDSRDQFDIVRMLIKKKKKRVRLIQAQDANQRNYYNGEFVLILCTTKYKQIWHSYFIINCFNC